MVSPRKHLPQPGQKGLATSDPLTRQPSQEDEQPSVNHEAHEEDDDVIDPDPCRWALLQADSQPVAPAGHFTQVQLVHMNHLGHKVGWNLQEYQLDRTILSRICTEIGIDRNQFRAWVHNQKKKRQVINAKASQSGSSTGGNGGNHGDEGGPSSAPV